MSLWYLYAYGTVLGAQPFAFFAPLLSLAAFTVVVFIILSLKEVLDNKNQRILW